LSHVKQNKLQWARKKNGLFSMAALWTAWGGETEGGNRKYKKRLEVGQSWRGGDRPTLPPMAPRGLEQRGGR